jgi:hypothetical protein
MPHSVNNNFIAGYFVEDEIWVGSRDNAPNGGIVCRRASQRIERQQIDDRPNSSVNARSSLWRAIAR